MLVVQTDGCRNRYIRMDRARPRYRTEESRRMSNRTLTLDDGNIIRNHFATGDGSDPVTSLKSLQEIFRGKLDVDVVQLVFSECGCNVDQALETLFALASEDASKPLTQDCRLKLSQTNRKPSWYSEFSVADSGENSDSSEMDSGTSGDDCRHVVDVVCHETRRGDRSDEDDGQQKQRSTETMIHSALPSHDPHEPSDRLDSLRALINSGQKKVLVILRGLPGSGKSTLARSLKANGVIFSTDDFFYVRGCYRFDPSLLTEAHVWNRRRAQTAMEEKLTPVIIDNTNTQWWEFQPYVVMAKKYRYSVRVAEPQTNWKFKVSELVKKNSHGVSREAIARMLERYEHNAETSFEQLDEETSEDTDESRSAPQKAENVTERQPEALKEKIGLDDLMALTQHDSEESCSVSRRTSASSSQDTSGWECDEEFTWAADGPKTNDRVIQEDQNIGNCFLDSSSNKETTFQRISNSFCSAFTTKESARSLHCNRDSGLLNLKFATDWSIPDYPRHDIAVESTEEVPPEMPRSAEITNSETQTESADFVAYRDVLRGLDAPAEYSVRMCHLVSGLSTHLAPVAEHEVFASPVLDKSTMTENRDGDEESTESKIKRLGNMFPHIAHDDLRDILEKCHWDHSWAINILLDFGCEYNDPHKTTQTRILPAEKDAETKPTECEREQPQVVTATDEIHREYGPLTLTLTLDPVFAMQLEELFGPVGFHVTPDVLSAKDLQVTIDIAMARRIHQQWKRTVTDALQSELRTLIRLQNENHTDGAPSLVAFGEAFPWSELPEARAPWSGHSASTRGQEPLPLSVIMDMEQEVDNKRKELFKKLLPCGDDLSTKLKRQRLYEIFPGVDKTAVDEVFEANKCSFPETVLAIQHATGSCPSPSLAQDCEDQLLEKAKLESIKVDSQITR